MPETTWAAALDTIREYAFKISTPSGTGTGFLLTVPNPQGLCSVATAYHVVAHAHEWEEPIKLMHTDTREIRLLSVPDRFIFVNPQRDVAVIAFFNNTFNLPSNDLSLSEQDKYIKPGILIGWAGYPAIAPNTFSFFSGTISCFLHEELAYLVDGVAINGVSGGPAFCVLPEGEINAIGVVTAYIPNRVTGESLPGVCFVSGIHPLYSVVKQIKSYDEAREKAKELEGEQSPGPDPGRREDAPSGPGQA